MNMRESTGGWAGYRLMPDRKTAKRAIIHSILGTTPPLPAPAAPSTKVMDNGTELVGSIQGDATGPALWKRLAVVVMAGVLLTAGVGGTVTACSNAHAANAVRDCTSARQDLTAAGREYKRAVRQWQTVSSKFNVSGKDGGAAADIPENPPACPVDGKAAKQRASEYAGKAGKLREESGKLNTRASSIQRDAAHDALKAKRDEAQSTLESSKGKVVDENTRENLRRSIAAADKMLEGKHGKTEHLERELAPMQTAIEAVRASVQAKSDQEAKAVQEQAAPQPQAPTQSQTMPTTPSPTYRPTTPSPTYRPNPQRAPLGGNAPAAPTPNQGWSVPAPSHDEGGLPDHL
ncbi:hypothetical protein [Bifidobacterium xylocopae]|uniref:Colicin transporter n=1 Tax=Bifidobacterium xylocopae TaxID=2493119 RepID=A0A366KC77_9BIFI|nr:hypothetical protein [Bifidobacterium xylocopae]RBP98842.1 hypothetical protein CRD59_07050 [Bifidobacterium xylocopae]